MFAKVFAFFVLCISAVNAFQNMGINRLIIDILLFIIDFIFYHY